ncbi:MAG: CehA/McbA family metallohydrolase [Clostridia bacterium]|nr:CehA/McbA family metallohydrolase [Clostridia bacterium]
MKLFDGNKPFFKGNLHCHTTLSDGKLTPEQCKAFYRSRGYDFLAITDHRRLCEVTHMEDGLLVLSGMEMDYLLPGEALHLVGIGMTDEIARCDLSRNPQGCINQMNRCGGRVILAHPAWSLNTVTTITGLHGIAAAEIYNSVSTYPWNGDRADSSNVLDAAAAHGAILNVVASDDSHWYNGEAGRSCTMVEADDLTQESLFEAMDAGRFYCTQGPEIRQITVENNTICVECSPAQRVIFYSNLVWTPGRCVTQPGLTCASYTAHPENGEAYVRVQVMDGQGLSAWSNPVILERGKETAR